MAESIINSSHHAADIVFIAANNDISSSFGKGAHLGPEAVKRCLDGQIEFMEPRTRRDVREKWRIGWDDLGDLNGDRTPAALNDAVDRIREVCRRLQSDGALPFLIGGDHSNAIGSIGAALDEWGPENVSVLHIDAHHDLRRDDSDFRDQPFGPNNHGSALRAAADRGAEIVQVGIRAFSREEREYAASRDNVKVRYFGCVPDFEPLHPRRVAQMLTRQNLYITVDVDGFDPAVMPGTGTPVNGGLSWQYGNDLIWYALQKHGKTHSKLIGADICEVAPRPDGNLTEYSAAQLAYNIITWARG